MPTHKLRCRWCGKDAPVRMDTKTDRWVFKYHWDARTRSECAGVGKPA